MATLARARLAEAGYEVLLVTGDKDMLQVGRRSRSSVLAPQAKGDDYARLDADGVRAKWGVAAGPDPRRAGADGRRVGRLSGRARRRRRPAVELMSQFGSVDALYDAASPR